MLATAEEIEARTGQISPGGFHAVVDFVNNPTTIGRGVKFLAKVGSYTLIYTHTYIYIDR